MKTKFTIILLFISIAYINGQQIQPDGDLIFTDTLTLNPLHSWINIPDSNKVWEIGIPNKSGMGDSYDNLPAIVTKLDTNYPLSSNDYFDITLPYLNYRWGEGVLSFWHKFDTDSLKDGGLILVSNDNGTTWTNLISSNIGISSNFNGLYTKSDTISGGFNAFTGKSALWENVELYWHWLALTKSSKNGITLRFKFISGKNSTAKGGWEISHLVFKGYSVIGAVDVDTNNGISLFPNPSNDKLKICIANNYENIEFRLFDQLGLKLIDIPILNKMSEINLKQYKDGIYLYSISQDDKIIKTGKIVKQK